MRARTRCENQVLSNEPALFPGGSYEGECVILAVGRMADEGSSVWGWR